MRALYFGAPVLSVVVVTGLLLPSVELPAAPHVTRSEAPAVYRPQVALTASTSAAVVPVPPTVLLPEMVAAASVPAPASREVTAEGPIVDDVAADSTPAPLTPIDVIDAIGAAAYLAVAGPLLVVSIPFQVITGQSEGIVVSLNNLIQAANTILKLVGRSIAPIPVPSERDMAEAAPATEVAAVDAEDTDVRAAEEPEAEDTEESEVYDTGEPQAGDAEETERADKIERTDEAEDSDDTEGADEAEETEDTEPSAVDSEPATDDADAKDTDAESDTVTG